MGTSKVKIIRHGFCESGLSGALDNIVVAKRAGRQYFHDEHSCALLATGECPVRRLKKAELLGLKDVRSVWLDATSSDGIKAKENYCLYLAERMISRDSKDAWALEHNPGDGRHRDCIAEVLRSKGIDVNINVK